MNAGIQQRQPHSLDGSIFYTFWVNDQWYTQLWEPPLAQPSKYWFHCKQERKKKWNENQKQGEEEKKPLFWFFFFNIYLAALGLSCGSRV